MKVEVDPLEIQERAADERGRITIGMEYADETVTVAVIEVEDDDGR